MPFQSIDTLNKPRIGQAMSLGRGHIDPATLTLTFHYQEKQESGGVWSTVDLEQALTEGVHFSLNARDGQITLLPHAFWDSESTWRAGDRTEPLLYKDQVKHPQYISGGFEYYEPESVRVLQDMSQFGALGRQAVVDRSGVSVMINLDMSDTDATNRLGYSVLRFTEGVDG